jgi:hypothetical protein
MNVSGYYVGDRYFLGCTSTCIEILKKWHDLGRHMFVESQVTGPKEEYFVDMPGIYRFQLVMRNNDLCKTQDELRHHYPIYFNKYRIPEGYCIYSKKIEEPSAEYIVKEWHWDTNYSQLFGIARVRSLVQHKDTGDIVGSNTGFTHKGGWLRRWIAGFMAVGKPDECIEHGEYGFTWSVLRGVFNSH